MSLVAGTKLGRYEIRTQLGAGGMGEVYLAQDTKLDRKVALKILPADVGTNRDRMERFVREAKSAAALNHPNIAHIYEIGESDGTHYIAMEFIDGETLRHKIHRDKAPLPKLLKYLTQVAQGLSKAHAAGIIHRDLKPANLMIDGNSGRVMLIDFGIARWVKQEEKGVTAVGTMGYAPPELFGGRVEPRSDIYSLGATLFHLLTGADPQDNPLLIFDFQKNSRPRQIAPSISSEMEQILMRSVEYKPEDRFASAGAMRDALGPDFEILVEAHRRFAPSHAIRIGQRLVELGIDWYEEPCLADNLALLAEVRRAVPIPIVTGEALYTKEQFFACLALRAADILNPDICAIGGISALMDISTMAQPQAVVMSPHNYNSPLIGMAATVHVSAVIPNFRITEYFVNFEGICRDIATASLSVNEGWIDLPTAPGLGIDIDVERCSVILLTRRRAKYEAQSDCRA